MKRIVLCIFFLITVVWGWNTAAGYCVLEKVESEETAVVEDQLVQRLDPIISVLMAANSYTDVTVQPTNTFASNLARRYRPAGFSFDKFMDYQAGEWDLLLNSHLKTTYSISQEYAARQKYAGYYIYSLRRIII